MSSIKIVHYLVITSDKVPGKNGYRVLIDYTTYDLALNTLVDTNFYALRGHKDYQYNFCVKICTGFVVTLVGAQVLFVYKIKIDIDVITLEEEYIVIYHYIRYLLPL